MISQNAPSQFQQPYFRHSKVLYFERLFLVSLLLPGQFSNRFRLQALSLFLLLIVVDSNLNLKFHHFWQSILFQPIYNFQL